VLFRNGENKNVEKPPSSTLPKAKKTTTPSDLVWLAKTKTNQIWYGSTDNNARNWKRLWD